MEFQILLLESKLLRTKITSPTLVISRFFKPQICRFISTMFPTGIATIWGDIRGYLNSTTRIATAFWGSRFKMLEARLLGRLHKAWLSTESQQNQATCGFIWKYLKIQWSWSYEVGLHFPLYSFLNGQHFCLMQRDDIWFNHYHYCNIQLYICVCVYIYMYIYICIYIYI